MHKKLLAVLLLSTCSSATFAQVDFNSQNKERDYEHIVGVQVNGLVNQSLNLSKNNPTVYSNPYLLTYNINSVKSGLGLRFGFGYNYYSFKNVANSTEYDKNINDLHFRLGIEKKYKISNRWTAGAGIDFVYKNYDDKTFDQFLGVDGGDGTTHTTGSNYGGGAMAWLRFAVTKHLVVGTEASLYYTMGKQKTDWTSSGGYDPGPQAWAPTSGQKNEIVTITTLSLPMVFYLSLKF